MILTGIRPGRLLSRTCRNSIHSIPMSNQQPSWHFPTRDVEEPVLKLYNSFTRTKNEFVPRNGRHVKWYNCGPTVYDASHMGHARNYVTQDILRRIMTDYFGYDVHFVMNITDIEDKIILRARQNYLLDKFRDENRSLSAELIARLQSDWLAYVREKVSKGLPESDRPEQGEEESHWPRIVELAGDRGWKQECLKRDDKFDMQFSTANRAFLAIRRAQNHADQGHTDESAAIELIHESRDVLAPSLDAQLGATVTDPSIFRSLSSHWESRFFEDMARLRVREPDTLTRVTEYVPEIVSFIEQIMRNGYAYHVNGSVYFDTKAFDNSDGHVYAKLEPRSKYNRDLLEEGEGELSSKTERRSPSDFALWKASKPGEPTWPSPWGRGRPGWHIECSVMASAVLGENLDIHSGGIDLAFPHHDNEIAQSEAYYNSRSWVNYFLHTGHLHIEGLKMSKSLKNFITIDEILQKYTARQLRLAFLLQLWNSKVDFSETLVTGEVRTLETAFNNFFTIVKALASQAQTASEPSDGRNNYLEIELTKTFHDIQTAFRTALCDSFNTPAAVDLIRELVSRTNVYINSRGKNVNVALVECVARWVSRMLRMFGLGEGENSDIGWGHAELEGGDLKRDEVLMPYLRTLSSFRDGVRRLAMAKSDSALKEILALSDKLRDIDLVPLGVALDDQENGRALVKLVPPAELIRARDEKRAQMEAKAAKKAAAVQAEQQKRLQKLEKGRLPPEDMFKPPNVPERTYGSWNEVGLPITDGDGKELSRNQAKKVQKAWAEQTKLHEEFLAWRNEQGE